LCTLAYSLDTGLLRVISFYPRRGHVQTWCYRAFGVSFWHRRVSPWIVSQVRPSNFFFCDPFTSTRPLPLPCVCILLRLPIGWEFSIKEGDLRTTDRGVRRSSLQKSWRSVGQSWRCISIRGLGLVFWIFTLDGVF